MELADGLSVARPFTGRVPAFGVNDDAGLGANDDPMLPFESVSIETGGPVSAMEVG